jgi:hypothetical protein
MQDEDENCKQKGTCIKKIAKQKHNKRTFAHMKQ